MVMRSIEINQISFARKGRDKKKITKKIRELFGESVDITITENDILVKGDMHDHRKRKALVKFLMGVKDGQSV